MVAAPLPVSGVPAMQNDVLSALDSCCFWCCSNCVVAVSGVAATA